AGMLSCIAVCGVTKAVVNYFAGRLADVYGRRPVLIAGWLVGLPVPLLLIWAPPWGWVVAAAWAPGAIAQTEGLRPAPFFLGLAFAALGLGLSALFVRETRDHVAEE